MIWTALKTGVTALVESTKLNGGGWMPKALWLTLVGFVSWSGGSYISGLDRRVEFNAAQLQSRAERLTAVEVIQAQGLETMRELKTEIVELRKGFEAMNGTVARIEAQIKEQNER